MAGSAEIARQTIPAFNVTSPVGAEIVHEIRSTYQGEQIVVSSEASKLTDAAEELGMAVAQRADSRSLGQRTVRQGRGTNPEALGRLTDTYEKLPDMPEAERLHALVEWFRGFEELFQQGGQPSEDDVLRLLGEFDPDVSHQFAALDVARGQIEEAQGDPRLLVLLDQVKARFETGETAREVRAGFAVAALARQAAATMETDPAAVRESYRAMLREAPHIGQLFDAMMRFDLSRNFEAAVKTFMAAAGRDLASTGPSTDPVFLHALLTELGKLKKMQTAFEATGTLVRLAERTLPPRERGTTDIVDQASRLLNFAARPAAGLNDACQLLGAFENRALPVQIVFANGLRHLHGEIPDEVMPSHQARAQQAAAIMALLDALVAREEASYAGGAA